MAIIVTARTTRAHIVPIPTNPPFVPQWLRPGLRDDLAPLNGEPPAKHFRLVERPTYRPRFISSAITRVRPHPDRIVHRRETGGFHHPMSLCRRGDFGTRPRRSRSGPLCRIRCRRGHMIGFSIRRFEVKRPPRSFPLRRHWARLSRGLASLRDRRSGPTLDGDSKG